MHRRTFLISTAIIGIAGCLGACSRNLKTGPTPSIAPAPTLGPESRVLPPADGAAPSSFSEFPLWPEGDIQTTVTALHKQHLCGTAEIPELDGRVSNGLCPVVVDLSGPSTWAIIPDGKENWSIMPVKMSPAHRHRPVVAQQRQPGHMIRGPPSPLARQFLTTLTHTSLLEFTPPRTYQVSRRKVLRQSM